MIGTWCSLVIFDVPVRIFIRSQTFARYWDVNCLSTVWLSTLLDVNKWMFICYHWLLTDYWWMIIEFGMLDIQSGSSRFRMYHVRIISWVHRFVELITHIEFGSLLLDACLTVHGSCLEPHGWWRARPGRGPNINMASWLVISECVHFAQTSDEYDLMSANTWHYWLGNTKRQNSPPTPYLLLSTCYLLLAEK